MIKNTILFYYENDSVLGNYFSKCAAHAITLLEEKSDIKQAHITNSDCNFAYIDHVELPKHNEKSLFLIYSHGNSNSFFKEKPTVPFIHQNINCEVCLSGGLVYTNACSTGIEFGKNLPSKGASYFGYDSEIKVYFKYEEDFIECDNWGLYRLLEGDTLEESKIKAKEKFNQKIDKIYKYSPLAAGALEDAKNSIVVCGDTLKRFI